jgi:GDP-mannose 6-dehydrogenase
MKVAVYGLGYVGSVTAACLAEAGHHVVGVDVHPGKVAAIAAGESPIVEPGIAERVHAAVNSGTLRASTEASDAADCEVAVLCVGTPSLPSGAQDLGALERVSRDAARAFASAQEYPVVIVRSTVLPGALRERLAPALESASGRRVGERIGLCVVPEFLREGSAVADFKAPPMTVIGAMDARGASVAEALFHVEGSPTRRVDPDAAVMVKYASNAFHALKVAFANEIDALCTEMNVDGRAVMDLFALDDKLNISPRYLRPGFAFGGSCLPKDLRALVHAARHLDATVPVLDAVLPSNAARVQRAVDEVVALGVRRVALLGLSFKPGTDDLRESPLVTLAETLLGKGFALRIYDPSLTLDRLTGANQRFIERAIPHLERLLAPSPEAAVEDAEVVLVGHALPGLRDALRLRPSQKLIDLTRMPARP